MRGTQTLKNGIKLMVPLSLLAAAVAKAQVGPPPVGGPLPGLTQAEISRFNAGRLAFGRNETPQTGLGPVFNGTSCLQCHRAGAPGGASADNTISVVRRIGAVVNGAYSDLTNVGGALLQARSLREFIPNYPVPGEIVPIGATFVSRRTTTPVWGNGLMESIPAGTILAAQDPTDRNGDGISGKANMVLNPETNVFEVGRFGWKNQVSSVHVFSGDAFLNEMGITNQTFPRENLPQGRPIPPGADTVPELEDRTGKVSQAADFMRFSAPPPQLLNLSARGRALFGTIGCASCHTPVLNTGPNASAALANKPVNLYSDLLLHDMGPQLADGIQQGNANGAEWRTAPLWGLRFRPFLLHDGRARTPDAAIRAHGGEAAPSANRYNLLTVADRNELLNFVGGL